MKADEMTDRRTGVETDESYVALMARVLGDADDAPPPEDAAPTPAPAPARSERGSRGRNWPAAVLAALVVIGAVAAGVLGLRVREADAVDRARVAALAAARSHAQAILSYDHRTLDADFARAGKVITGAFKGEYERTTTAVVRPTATQYRAVVKAEVTSAGVVRASADRVVVLLFVDQTTTSTRLPTAKRDSSRVRMTLDNVGGRWLVSAVDAL
jgi:Mce-associated membrane protein